MKKIIMATIIGLITCFYAQDVGKKPQAGYRIEVVVDTVKEPYFITQTREVRFTKPDGEICLTKKASSPVRLEMKGEQVFWADSPILISENKRFCLEITKVTGEGNAIIMERVLWNAQGKKKWTKSWKTYPSRVPGDPYWAEGMSSDGSTIYVSYKDSLQNYWIVCYDTLGKEISKVSNKYGFRDIGLSFNGHLLGAYTIMSLEDDNKLLDLFFLDVKSGRTKIVKGGGMLDDKQWGAGFSFSTTIGSERCVSKVYITCGIENVPGWGGFLSFDEIPDDLSTLFFHGGEK